MGFAVVADEVRALAQRSAQAAKDTSEKIESAVKRSELGGVASANVVKSLGEVEVTAQNIQQVFAGISSQIKSLDQIISQIAAASQEQTAGINEVNMAVSQLDKVTQSNASGAEENASSAQVLKQQSTKMLHAVEELHVIVTGQTNATSQSFAAVPNDRDDAAFAFEAAPKTKKSKAPATRDFQNF
jgi:methyl-accepting chemotaxis protein